MIHKRRKRYQRDRKHQMKTKWRPTIKGVRGREIQIEIEIEK